MSKKRNRHTEEFKREAVRLMLSRGERTVGDVARSVTCRGLETKSQPSGVQHGWVIFREHTRVISRER